MILANCVSHRASHFNWYYRAVLWSRQAWGGRICETPEVAGRIVISGAGGLVGRTLAGMARARGDDVLALTSAQWDITDPTESQRVIEAGDVVVNCGAYTKVDAAESEPDRAYAVNVSGPGRIAETCARVGAALIHLSTDYVFDGDFGDGEARPYEIDDRVAPLSVYGRTKLDGERAVLAAMPEAKVVRTAWIYEGRAGSDFVAALRRAAAGADSVDVVTDQVGSPTYVGDLCESLLQIVDGSARAPILHAANSGAASRFQQAQAIFEEVGADPARVRPVTSDRFPRPAPRPSYSALSGVQSAAAGLVPLRPWREGLAEALRAPI
jgi:dTDP-4-dehydrorhamnose reductase